MMEVVKIETPGVQAVPNRRDEVACPFKKFVLAANNEVPSFDPTTGLNAFSVNLGWTILYDFDPNGFIGYGSNGGVSLKKAGLYHVLSRITFRADTPGNTEQITYLGLELVASGSGDVDIRSGRGGTNTGFLRTESSPGAGDDSGTSLLVSKIHMVTDDGNSHQAPQDVFTVVGQGSNLLQPQTLVPHDYDVWCQVVYLGRQDALGTGLALPVS